MLAYDFGSRHPLKPERLRRTIELLSRYGLEPIDPGLASDADVLRRHNETYLEAVKRLSAQVSDHPTEIEKNEYRRQGWDFGFGSIDNPPFAGMYEASLAYLGGTVRAAEAVRDGAPLAINLAGGLHHAQRSHASGFCMFDDPAIALDVLLEKFHRVAYIDIDLHHGDGVQALWLDDPRVLTYSIHQHPRAFYPGTGFVEEVGAVWTSMNVPLEPGTTGDVWLWAFENTALPALHAFQPEAVVLQMGADAHFEDPLGHLMVSAQDWLGAFLRVQSLGLPLVAVGGGGYNLSTVPRMWAAATLTLLGIPFDSHVPGDLAHKWEMPRYFDHDPPRGEGLFAAEAVVQWLVQNLLPNLPTPAG